MSLCYHPQLFDGERFHRERASARSQVQAWALLSSCMEGYEDVFGWGLDESDLESDFISSRSTSDGARVGSLVDNVIAGLGRRAGSEKLIGALSHVTESRGRRLEFDSYLGYFTQSERGEVLRELQTVSLASRSVDHDQTAVWEERDRKILVGLLEIAQQPDAGIVWSVA